jgi:Mg2+ and Co2+ transporter CorA
MNFRKNKILDPIWDNPDLLKVNSAKRLQEINENLSRVKNPIDTANERLSNIEDNFSEINKLLLEAIKSNEKASKIALWISIAAILIAVFMPLVQMMYG